MNNNPLEEGVTRNYAKLIPNKSPVRRQLLQLFIQAGLKDIEAQILLSIVLHGGKMRPPSIAKDLDVDIERLWQPFGILSLERKRLIGTTHHKPKIVVLNITIDELIEYLVNRSFNAKDYAFPTIASDLLHRIHKMCLTLQKEENTWNFDYYSNLKLLNREIKSFFFLVDYSLSSLYLTRDQSVFLALLVIAGGIVPKRLFYKQTVKSFIYEDYLKNIDFQLIETDLKKLGYSSEERQNISNIIFRFSNDQSSTKLHFSKEHQYNVTIQSLSDYCLTTTETVIDKTGKKTLIDNLILGPTLNRLADLLFQFPLNLKTRFKLELYHLQMAYHNVELIDPAIYISFIRDKFSTIKRIKRELKHAKQVQVSFAFENLLNEITFEIFNSLNQELKVNFLIDENNRDTFTQSVNNYVSVNHDRRGILDDDKAIFVPFYSLDDLENTIIFKYNIGGSNMIEIHRTSFNGSPVDITSIDSDVNYKLQSFQKFIDQYSNNTIKILSLIKNP